MNHKLNQVSQGKKYFHDFAGSIVLDALQSINKHGWHFHLTEKINTKCKNKNLPLSFKGTHFLSFSSLPFKPFNLTERSLSLGLCKCGKLPERWAETVGLL